MPERHPVRADAVGGQGGRILYTSSTHTVVFKITPVSFKHLGVFVLQKNFQTLQSAVDSLQKEKEDLVLALQSAKKDTNQAKYEHSDLSLFVLVVIFKSQT